MDDNSSHEGSNSVDLDTDDEPEIATISPPSFEFVESCSSSDVPSKVVLHYMGMGFSQSMVTKVIEELGESDADAIVDALRKYSVGDIPQQEIERNDPNMVPDLDSFFSDFDLDSSDEDEDDLLVGLIDMGCSPEEPEAGKDTTGSRSHVPPKDKKRKLQRESKKKNFNMKGEKKRNNEDDDEFHFSNPMIEYGVSGHPCEDHGTIPSAAQGPPYFFFENVARTPKGVWTKIKSFLYEIDPEFVDSKHFCAATRKRGYIHNLPLKGRFMIQPSPPKTIFEALPRTKEWWPSWDKRIQLNCILTRQGTGQVTTKIKSLLDNSVGGEPDLEFHKFFDDNCKKYNMVWTGKNTVVPLEPHEIELIMGYPTDHTRGATRGKRYEGLGNAFQVDTVGYLLSVLKKLYPNGINVLSLFSGIGGAEVALHAVGVKMNNVVSVEKSSVCKTILQGWWDQTKQKGKLVHFSDVKDVTREKLEEWISLFGGLDLVIGGSPCNNLAGCNRATRDGLEGEDSSLFFDYVRILREVKSIMGRD